MDLDVDTARDRLRRIFRFLQAYNQIKNPVPRVVTERWTLWLDEVPTAPSVSVASITDGPTEDEPIDQEGVVLRARRPKLTECPTPPAVLDGWLEDGWRHPEREARVAAVRTLPTPSAGAEERFDAVVARVEAFQHWRASRAVWAAAELPQRKADQLFQSLYALHNELRRESERFELVLGDGNLAWQRSDGEVHHPLVLQVVQLELDAELPEFRIVETDHEVELHTALLRSFEEVDGGRIRECREEVVKLAVHPLAGNATDGFLRALALALSGHGVLTKDRGKPNATEHPTIYRRPVVFLRPRAIGFAKILDGILADIESGSEPPGALLRIAGLEQGATIHGEDAGGFADGDVLLSKLANAEQIQIVKRLHDHGSVLVQGPPGTGKSHTIGNLIGHLLAEGKSVLVTSHTTKALSVLRSHVEEELRPLCVSVLDSEVESRRQLEQAVTQIADRLARADRAEFAREAASLVKERVALRTQVEQARAALREARLDEQRPLVAAGVSWHPSEAARLVADRIGQDDWIPGPIEPGAPLPLAALELLDLYQSNAVLSTNDERDSSHALPNPDALLPPERYASLLLRLGAPPSCMDRAEWWQQSPAATDPEMVSTVQGRLATMVQRLESAPGWCQDAALAGMAALGSYESWQKLASQIDAAAQVQAHAADLFLRFEPVLPQTLSAEDSERLSAEILAHLEQGRALGFWKRLGKPAWRSFARDARVAGARPHTAQHFRALRAEAALVGLREEIRHRWTKLMETRGAPSWKELGQRPELACLQFAAEIRRQLAWKTTQLDPELERLRALGFRWESFLEAEPAVVGPRAALQHVLQALSRSLPPILAARIQAAERDKHQQQLASLRTTLESLPATGSAVQAGLTSAVAAGDSQLYRSAFERLVDLHGLGAVVRRRATLLDKLKRSAPAWSTAILTRAGVHGQAEPPGDAAAAWTWMQLAAELERRARKSLPALQAQLDLAVSRLRDVTVTLIDRRAWSTQLARTSLRQQQALVGWLDLWRRIGKSKGKRAPALRAEAARQMQECRTAVPVWIMPLARVAELFDGHTRFDVIVIDEASQSDIMGLVALYLGKSAVVVGDHEQVSPSAVGQQVDRIAKLIEEHLAEIPNRALYDGKTSIYDLARQSFAGLICLTEHFRCYPPIIEFSNRLSYEGRIKPLREPSLDAARPFVVPHRVAGAARVDDANPTEALHVASLLVACLEQFEYRDASFGVVSLLGDEQAMAVENLLRTRIPETEYARRRVLCGSAAQFQGDERDVMFLSLVDASTGAPQRLRAEPMYQQRFNVAASRARDQMWVVYSLDPHLDLKVGDLRRKLIEHALDPEAYQRDIESRSKRTESDFERRVMERLLSAGYDVHPQHAVGGYRIDLVVEGQGGRLAVECDGERYHTIENLDADMARQADLERHGWKFVRIRGSVFYRDPDGAMRAVFDRLRELGIQPSSQTMPATVSSSDLLERVIRRAAELRLEWTKQENDVTTGVVLRLEPPVRRVGEAVSDVDRPVLATDTRPQRTGRTDTAQRGTASTATTPVTQAVGSVELAPVAPAAVDVHLPTARRAEPAGPAHAPYSERAQAILRHLEAKISPEQRACPACDGRLSLHIRSSGPFLRCADARCEGKRAIFPSLTYRAVEQAGLRCACRGKLVLRRGAPDFLGCTSYPKCRNSLSWREL